MPRSFFRPGFALIAAFALIGLANPALAHIGGHGQAGGFVSGLIHPVVGWDHVLAMVAVGLWGAFLGNPAIWILPVVFPMVMALGAVIGILGLPLPAVEIGIALSAVVLGVMIGLAARPPIWVAAIIVGLFAVFHGYAHGAELPNAVSAYAYAGGFVIATGLLHMAGIAFGLVVKWPAGRMAVRGAGGVISLAGVAFLAGLV
ncbi:MAG: HupE/UreJ family protein [Pseudomonadota bacterium]